MESGEKIRRSLHTMLTQAQIDFEMWQAMRKARSDADTVVMLNRRYHRFYSAAENALFNSMITILYKLFETRSDTVNFNQLRKEFPADIRPEVKEEIDELFRRTKPIWRKVLHVRNKVVGHQSLGIEAGEVHRIAGITIDELEGMIEASQRLLHVIAKNFHDTHVVFNLKGTQSFDNLIADLRRVRSSSLGAVEGLGRNSRPPVLGQ